MGDDNFIELPELPRVKRLSPREFQVLRCLASGMTAPEMAVYLHIKEGTCANHVKSIRNKMLAKSSVQAVSIAYKEGLLK